MMARPDTGARQKLLDAALSVVRRQGYAATSIEDLCTTAGVTKGAFFHHFPSKEALGVAAAQYWSQITGEFFRNAPYHKHDDPLDRVLGYIDFRKAIIRGGLPEFTCLVGTMVQEAYGSHPAIRQACEESITGHALTLEADIGAAMRNHGISGEFSARSLALHTQAVLQGAFVLAKATGGPEAAVESIDHLRRYFELLFGRRPSPAKGARS
ncbi:MAG: TetR/AcrR family transcriptional regulator [Nitratireductor sp.]|jgi:TetR/AcrR family transcriptional repressor of nem operon|nr:TetR/AcrR family transcriptional regulator [Nitratireductor sp.]